ncbi:hypothetical protein GCM10009808_06770 [Microbacterium sediminicola]|uniref:Uncharacterized protein n=1 Tax=Microbacterium sediminicola TaxID=415210 RepID=A0ABP4TSM8_9MICO
MPVDDGESLRVKTLGKCASLFVQHIRRHHASTLASQPLNMRSTLSLGRTGNECSLVFEPINHAEKSPGGPK